jgi:hypothetical protein
VYLNEIHPKNRTFSSSTTDVLSMFHRIIILRKVSSAMRSYYTQAPPADKPVSIYLGTSPCVISSPTVRPKAYPRSGRTCFPTPSSYTTIRRRLDMTFTFSNILPIVSLTSLVPDYQSLPSSQAIMRLRHAYVRAYTSIPLMCSSIHCSPADHVFSRARDCTHPRVDDRCVAER